MNFLSRGSGMVIVLMIAAAALLVLGATGFFNRSATPSEPPLTGPHRSGPGVEPSSNRATPPRLPPPALGEAPEIAIDGAALPSITGDELAARPSNLQAADRRAWRLTDLIGGSDIQANTVIHAITIDGEDYILND